MKTAPRPVLRAVTLMVSIAALGACDPVGVQAPDREQVARMEEWLSNTGKTLVFIGSDYSGEKEYWEAMLEDAPEDKIKLIEQGLRP